DDFIAAYAPAGDDTIYAGAGDDYVFDGFGSNFADLGDGDDTFQVLQQDGGISTVVGGLGRDLYLVPASFGYGGQVQVMDFAAGANGDLIDVNQLLNQSGLLGGYSGGNPFDAAIGILRLTQDGGDTLLQWDQDGPSGPQ